MSWKSLFGSGELTELPEELAKLLAQAKRDNKTLRELLKRAETAEKKFKSLPDPLEAMQATAESLGTRMSELQRQVEAFDGAASTINSVFARSIDLRESQAAHVSSSEEADRTIRELATKVDELRTMAEDAITAKDEAAELMGGESRVTRLLQEVTRARADLERAEKRATTLGESVSRLEVLEQRADKIGKVQESLEGTVASSSKNADRTISELTKKVDELRSVAEDAITAKDEVAELTGPESGVTRLLEEVTSARADLERAEKRATTLGESVSRLEVLGQRADKIGKVQESLEGAVESSSKEAGRTISELTKKVDALRSVAEDAITAKDEVAELTGPESGVTRLIEEVTRARADLERAEKRATTLGESVSRLEVLGQRADKIGKVQESLEGTVASSSKNADRTIRELTTKVDELRSVAEDAITAKDEVAELTGPESGVTRLLEEVTTARADLERAEKRATTLGESVSRLEVLGQRADKIGKVQESLEGAVESSSKEAGRTISDLTKKVDELRSVAEDAITAKDEVAELTGPESGVTRLLEEVTTARADLERAEKRATTLGESVSRLEVLGQRADKIGKVQESLEGAVESSSKEAGRTISELTKKVDALRSVAEDAITAKDEVAELTGPESGVTRLLEEVTTARADLLGPKGSFTKVRADMDELMADVGRLEGRADTFGQVEERIVRVSEQAGELEEGQKLMARFFESVSEQVVQAEKEAGRTISELTTKVDGLRTVAEDAITVKDEMAELVGPESRVTGLLEEVTRARVDLSTGREARDRPRRVRVPARSPRAASRQDRQGPGGPRGDRRTKRERRRPCRGAYRRYPGSSIGRIDHREADHRPHGSEG